MSAPAAALAAVYRVMAAARVPAWLGRRGDAAIVFSYHNVVPDGAARGERVLHLGRTRFREQLARIARRFRVVPLAELLRRHRDGLPLRGLAAITFDDAYRGVVRHAVPLLAELGVPATIFVVAGALERHAPFWWDRLADGAGGVVPERQRLLADYAGDEARILAARPVPPAGGWDDAYFPATAPELAGLDGAAVALGLHTVTHPNLTRVPAARLAQEIDGGWRILRERFAAVLPVLAYPYGAVDRTVAAAARAAGLAGFAGATGAVTARAAPAALPRLFVGPDMSADALEVRTAWL